MTDNSSRCAMKKSIALYKILAVLLIGCAGPVAGAIAPIEDPPEPARQPTETRSAPQAAQVEARPTARPSSTPTVTLLACQFSGELLLEVYQAAGSLIAVDACTGAALADRDPISLRHVTISAVTPDGSRLVLVKARNSSGTNAELSLLDLATWQETATGTIFETWPRVVVSPDSRTAAFVYFSSVCCQATLETYDLAGQRPLAKHTFEPNQNPLHLWFDADGGSLIVYVEDDLTGETTQPSQIVRLDATTLRPLQDLTLDGVLDGWVEDASVAVPTTEPPGSFQIVEALIEPITGFVRYLPVSAMIPLLILWVGIDWKEKVAVIFLGTFFQQVILIADVSANVSKDLVDVSYTLGAGRGDVLGRVLIQIGRA